MYPRLIFGSKQSFFLLGVRGTGKSTWVKNWKPEALEIDLLEEAKYQEYLADPEKFAQKIATRKAGDWVFVDEIQRLPNLLNEVHRAIEKQKLNFILTGSSARKLRKVGTNLLAGRALMKFLYPLVPEELGQEFSINKVLFQGSLPLIWNASEPNQTLKTYIQMYLKEEIQAEAIVRNLGGFSRFLPISGLFHGQQLNVSNIARDSGTKRTTVQGFISILEDTLLAFRLPAYEAKLRVREKKLDKFYWIDPGLVRVVRKESEIDSENIGCLFEGWVAQLLRSYQEYRELFEEFFYWAPAESKETEVDFLLRRRKEFVAIEVKATKRLRDSHFKGLKAIQEMKSVKRFILVYLGQDDLKIGKNIEVLTVDSFCKLLKEDKLFF